MNKVLITGLELGNEIGICGGCGSLNFDWLLEKPSTLIWVDKIIITDIGFKKIINDASSRIDKSIKLILEIAQASDLLEIIKVDEKLKRQILKSTNSNEEKIIKEYTTKNLETGEKKFIKEKTIGKYEYCMPYVISLYRQMEIAKRINTNCLFNEKDINYIKNKKIYKDSSDMIGEIFKIYFPNQKLLHESLFEEQNNCRNCANFLKCDDKYLGEIEKNMKKVLKWRDYDEIACAKHEIDKIIKAKDRIGIDYSIEDIQNEFQLKQDKINRDIKKVFPKIKRWTGVTTIISLPLTIAMASTSSKNFAIASATISAIAKGVDKALDYYEEKNKWIGFINDNLNK